MKENLKSASESTEKSPVEPFCKLPVLAIQLLSASQLRIYAAWLASINRVTGASKLSADQIAQQLNVTRKHVCETTVELVKLKWITYRRSGRYTLKIVHKAPLEVSPKGYTKEVSPKGYTTCHQKVTPNYPEGIIQTEPYTPKTVDVKQPGNPSGPKRSRSRVSASGVVIAALQRLPVDDVDKEKPLDLDGWETRALGKLVRLNGESELVRRIETLGAYLAEPWERLSRKGGLDRRPGTLSDILRSPAHWMRAADRWADRKSNVLAVSREELRKRHEALPD